jgi:hypothetical protein
MHVEYFKNIDKKYWQTKIYYRNILINKENTFIRNDYMTATFWSNTIWYIVLGVSTIIEMIFVLNKAKNIKHMIALFLIVSGMTFCIEITIYCFLKAYDYYPMITPQSPINDGLVGNLFSQFSITATALLIVVLNLKYYWCYIFAGIYGIIEVLFLKLAIYSQNWYKTWMTILGLVILFGIVKKMSKSISIYTRYPWRYILMLFGLYPLHMVIIWWSILLTGIVGINRKILPDAMASYALISFLNLFILSITCMIINFSISKGWLKSVVLLFLYVTFYFAENLNIIYIKAGWFLIIATIDIFGMYWYVYFLDKLFNGICREVKH